MKRISPHVKKCVRIKNKNSDPVNKSFSHKKIFFHSVNIVYFICNDPKELAAIYKILNKISANFMKFIE